jgi:hypothetical protein
MALIHVHTYPWQVVPSRRFRARSGHGMGNLRRGIRDAACTSIRSSAKGGATTPMVQESRHANVVRVRGSTQFFWLRCQFIACKGPITVFPGQGYIHSRYAQSLDLFLGRGEANGLVEDEEERKRWNWSPSYIHQSAWGYSEAVTIFVTGAIFDDVILHPYLPYVTYLDRKCARIYFRRRRNKT